MNTKLTVRGRNIAIRFVQHNVSIANDDELAALLLCEAEAATDELASAIKRKYYELFTANFAVSDASLAVEIWGHVYVDKFADWIESLSSVAIIDKMANFVIQHCDAIDIGEKGHDNNRFVWNGLAPFKSMIAAFLPK